MKRIFAIYDSKVSAYERPFVAPNKGSALRAILDVFKDPNHAFTKWPADFTLFELGTWDEQEGVFTPHATKLNCGVLIELVPMATDSDSSVRNVQSIRDSIPSQEANRETRQ